MASPLNTFRSITANVTNVATTVYTCPAETSTIVLLAQVSNIHTSSIANVTFYSSNSGVVTELVKNFLIPVGDAASLISGKLVVEAGTSVGIYSNSNNSVKLTLSILETQ